ncbi:alpha/beta hydrolase [Streptomyces sp. NPDC006655]|uniref:alpha/beta hydrolase n=1 Tax=Streptomyces sp. NPDC006655 TaxID=3156898 RepID=UPI003452D2A8
MIASFPSQRSHASGRASSHGRLGCRSLPWHPSLPPDRRATPRTARAVLVGAVRDAGTPYGILNPLARRTGTGHRCRGGWSRRVLLTTRPTTPCSRNP